MVPTCYPGQVWLEGRTKDVPQSKWKDVSLPGGAVSFTPGECGRDLSSVSAPSRRGRRGLEKTDLERMPREPLKRKWCAVLAGIACSGTNPMVSADSDYNKVKALCTRLFRTLPRLPSNTWGDGPREGAWKHAWSLIDEILPTLESKPMPVNDWIASMPARRRKALAGAAERLLSAGWMKRCGKFKSFIKKELLPDFKQEPEYSDVGRLKEMVDRLINGPSDESHVIAGVHLKPMVEDLKRRWGLNDQVFYGSVEPGKLNQFLNERLMSHGCWALGDFTMFDGTYSDDAWWFMHQLYRRAGIVDPLFWRVMKAWQRPRGRLGLLKYQLGVVNASGRDDTGLANAILNGVATIISLAMVLAGKKSVLEVTVGDIRQVRPKVSLSVVGDDSVMGIPVLPVGRRAEFADSYSTAISEFGFSVKLKIVDRPFDVVYLGCRPYPCGSAWAWGRTIGRSTYKVGWCLYQKDRDFAAHITGIADMHTICSPHVPVLYDLNRRVVDLRDGAKRTAVVVDRANRPWEWGATGLPRYDAATLRYVDDGYGLPLGSVAKLIRQIEEVRRLPAVIDSKVWRAIIAADDL